MESSGSISDAQIFNRSHLREKIENGTLGLLPPEPPGNGGPDLHYFLLCDNAFALMSLMMKPYRKNSKLQDLQRQKGGGEHVWDISE